MARTTPLRVIIAGGGIGGLCLAQGLHAAGIDVAVYERDTAPDARLSGYRLNIQPVGATALHECLPAHLWQTLVATAGDPGPGMVVFTERLRLLMREDAQPADRPPERRTHAVSRRTLRRLLLDGLDGIVHFGKEFTGYQHNPDGTVTASFADGTSATGDVLVGADGARSRVKRQLLPHAGQQEAPGVGIGGRLPLADNVDRLPDTMTSTKNMVLPKRDFLFTAVFRRRDGTIDTADEDYVMWAYVVHRDTLPADATDRVGERLRDLVVSRMPGWHPSLRELIERTPPDTVSRVDFSAAAPVKPWPTTTVTLLGDAIHNMPPVGGLGGNAALYDANVLRRTLISVADGERELVPALAEYERDMLRHGFGAVREATGYLRLAIRRSRAVRTAARTFFRVCGTVGPLRRAVFSD